MDSLDLPAESAAQFETLRLLAFRGLLERMNDPKTKCSNAELVYAYYDEALEGLLVVVWESAEKEGWDAHASKAKIEAGIKFVIADFAKYHAEDLFTFPGRPFDRDNYRDYAIGKVLRSDRWLGIQERLSESARPAEPCQEHVELVLLLDSITSSVTIDEWCSANKLGRSSVMDWKASRFKGKVSKEKREEIETKIRDSAKLGLSTRT